MTIGQVCLRRGEEKELLGGGLWVFDNEIDWVDDRCMDGEVVEVLDSRCRFLALGFFNSRSKIAVRVFSRERNEQPDAGFFLWPESDRPIPEILPYIKDEALVELRDGVQYNPMPGHNNMRLCFGTPRSILMEGLERIADTMKKHR